MGSHIDGPGLFHHSLQFVQYGGCSFVIETLLGLCECLGRFFNELVRFLEFILFHVIEYLPDHLIEGGHVHTQIPCLIHHSLHILE